MLPGTPLPFPVAGAVRVTDQAQFHLRGGGQIFERTRATGLHDGDPCTVTTEAGHTITAGRVVVATH